MMKKWFSKYSAIIILLIISVIAARAFFGPGFIPTHDGEYHIIRFFEFDKAIKSGAWFPRWASGLNNGMGVPLFNFVYPLPNYIAEIFHVFGFSYTDSLKMVLASGLILSGLTFYILTRIFFSTSVSLVSSVYYVLAPYHLVDAYIRGSVGEVWSLAIAPLVLYFGITKNFALYSVMLALLILSHNILALMFFVFIISFLLFLQLKNKQITNNLFLYSFLALGLSSFYWLPALWEKQYVVGLEQTNIADHFPKIWQLILPTWGTGFSGTGSTYNQMSFQVGIPHLVMILITAVFLYKRRFLTNTKNIIFLVLSLITVLFFITPFSAPLWKIIPLFPFFQFPWRFLSLVIFISSILTGFVLQKINQKYVILFLFLAIVFYFPYTNPVIYQPRNDDYYLTKDNFTKGTNSPGDSFNTIWYKGNASKTGITYFPGWVVLIDGKPVKIEYEKDGLINYKVPAGKHDIVVKFTDTPVRSWAKIVSFGSLFLLILLFIHESRIQHKTAAK